MQQEWEVLITKAEEEEYRLAKMFLKSGIDTLFIDTARPYIDEVRALFRRRAHKR